MEQTKEELMQEIDSLKAQVEELQKDKSSYYKWYEDEVIKRQNIEKKMQLIKDTINII